MRVLIVGDVHGQHQQLCGALREIQSLYGIRAAIQVGDFGFYKAVMAKLGDQRIRFPVPLHVIDGNHEDHAWLQRALLTGAARHWKEEANLIYQPRPSLVHIGNTKIGFLGGALHIDRPQQHNLLSSLPNYLLRHHRQQAAILFNREQPDLIITHSCPAGIGIGMQGSTEMDQGIAEYIIQAGFDPGPKNDCGETELQQLWTDLKYRPRGWAFGHFHRPHAITIEGTRFVCAGNSLPSPQHEFVLWDTDEKKLLSLKP